MLDAGRELCATYPPIATPTVVIAATWAEMIERVLLHCYVGPAHRAVVYVVPNFVPDGADGGAGAEPNGSRSHCVPSKRDR